MRFLFAHSERCCSIQVSFAVHLGSSWVILTDDSLIFVGRWALASILLAFVCSHHQPCNHRRHVLMTIQHPYQIFLIFFNSVKSKCRNTDDFSERSLKMTPRNSRVPAAGIVGPSVQASSSKPFYLQNLKNIPLNTTERLTNRFSPLQTSILERRSTIDWLEKILFSTTMSIDKIFERVAFVFCLIFWWSLQVIFSVPLGTKSSISKMAQIAK